MKKTKILIPVLTVASLSAIAMPIVTCCSNKSTNKKYKIVYEDVNKVQGAIVTLDKTTYTTKEIEMKGVIINAEVSEGTSGLKKPALVLEKIIVGSKELVLNTDYFVSSADEKNMNISIKEIKCSGTMRIIFSVQEYSNVPVTISRVTPATNADVDWDPKFIDFEN
ncbi:MAG: hypothetical protein MJ200_01070 [Mycoplasmoidaceae bacterium]|nr:hypothetical protein [Mycoplasmoidaceae bacterium]